MATSGSPVSRDVSGHARHGNRTVRAIVAFEGRQPSGCLTSRKRMTGHGGENTGNRGISAGKRDWKGAPRGSISHGVSGRTTTAKRKARAIEPTASQHPSGGLRGPV